MHACKSSFLGLEWNWSTGLLMHAAAQLLKKNVYFWLGVRMTAWDVCAISVQSSQLLPRFAQILG